MNKTKAITANLVFAIQILLIFLLVFESHLQIPIWMQPLGRMHPMLLHLPIGLLLLLALLPLLKREISADPYLKVQSFVLYPTAFLAGITALIGFFLSQEGGYNADSIFWHKWTGVGVSFLTYGLLLLHKNFPERQRLFNLALIPTVIILTIAGHLGANITHGADYVLAPIRKAKPIFTADTPIFAFAVQPIFEAKCYSCHNERKSKGELIMTSIGQLMEGGKNGTIWVAGNPDSSRLIQRLHLPLEDEEHMPPEGKSQLSEAEIQVLHHWIKAGADVQQKLENLEESDTLYVLANQILEKQQVVAIAATYPFDFADEKTIESLNNPFRTIYPLALNSPALHAEIFVRKAYQPQFLEELTAIKEQLISLNLTNMPIQDEDLKTIAKFENLEQLLLNGTDITGKTLSELKVCNNLQQLALSGTTVEKEELEVLKEFPALQQVYIWNTEISTDAIADLQEKIPAIQWEVGYVVDEEEILQLSPPVLKNKNTLLAAEEKVVLENKFPGAIIRYTLDGSEPDSLNSPIYDKPFTIESFTTVTSKTYRENWKSSELAAYELFPKSLPVKEAELLTAADPKYMGEGASTLINANKGKAENFQNAAWLGFIKEPLDAIIDLGEQAPIVKQIIGSFAENVGSEIFPPAKVEVWGGNSKTNMKKLGSVNPKQPADYESSRIVAVPINIDSASFRYYRVVAQPLARIPKWHNSFSSKRKGWVFVDEVLFY